MSPGLNAPATFGLVELDLLTTYAGVELPFPLQVPAFGRVQPERDVLFAAASETLQARGLADENGPLAIADRLVDALARPAGGVDLVLGGPDWESGAVALVQGRTALLCLQRFNEAEHRIVEVEEIDLDVLADELLQLVPALPAGQSIPLRLPLPAMRAAHQVLTTARARDDQDTIEREVLDVLRSGGVDPAAASRLVALLHPLDGYGQMGVTRRAGGADDERVGAELSWIDTPAGRHRVGASPDGQWMSVNPLPMDDLHAMIRDFVAKVRR